MKKYAGVLKRAHQMEEKKGIFYATPKGKLYKSLRFIYTLLFVYTFFMNLFFVGGMFLQVDAGKTAMDTIFSDIIIVSVCTFFALVGLILMYCRVHIFSGILNIIPLPVTLLVYAPRMVEDMYPLEGWFGYKESFYWRHLIPVAVMAILAVWLTAIAVRAKFLFNNMYKKVIDDLFDVYKAEHKDEEIASGAEWQEFLENYNPDDYKTDKTKKNSKKKKEAEDEGE